MRQRLGLRLLAVMLLATFMFGSAACMGPQRRGGEPQEEKGDKEGGEKEKDKEKEDGEKEKEDGGGEKEKSDKEEK
ncbi:MAG TPA: hypothetical protein VD969_27585 [Symbiobacteriaceae bacterium]|nr:hypothetical protein [Symbiobacteriaceae bacterium]